MKTRILLWVLMTAIFVGFIGGSPYDKPGTPPVPIDEDEGGTPPVPIDEDEGDEVTIGDMILPREWLTQKNNDAILKRRPFDNEYKWPNSGGIVSIPYTVSGIGEDVVQRAAEVFKEKTCIRFVERASEAVYVAMTSGNGNQATIGYDESRTHTLTLSSNSAGSKGKLLHEMLHVLGFLHEQCRSDRDNYITVNTNNIIQGAESQFDIIESVDQSLPYDCDSILQYKATAFLKPDAPAGSVTISSSTCSHLGNDDSRLSLLDYQRINTFYNCDTNPNFRYYTVEINTNSWLASGTDCFIYLKLHGDQRVSAEFELDLDDARSSDIFERGSYDVFSKMVFRSDLGVVTGISVRMVDNGPGPDWLPDEFIVTDTVNNQKKKFTNNQWLSAGTTYGTDTFPLAS